MSDGKVTSADSGAKKKVKRGGVGTKQVCGGLGESHTCIRSSNIPHTHAFGSVGISSGSIMAASEDVRRCQKMSENIQQNQKKHFASFYYHHCRQASPPRNLPFIILNQQTNITALILKCHCCGKVPKATATDPKVFTYPNPHSLSLLLHIFHFSIHFTPHSPLPTLQ